MVEIPEERRRQARVSLPAAMPCMVKLPRPASGPTILRGQLRNVSVGGALIELGEFVAPTTRLAVEVASKTGSLDVEGEVIWVTDGTDAAGRPVHIHGVQFSARGDKPDPVLADLLRAYTVPPGPQGEPPVRPEDPSPLR